MSLAMHNRLNEEYVCAHLAHVTATQAAWILLQEPGFVGFGVVQKKAIYWPSEVQPDWFRVFDLRLFGEKGEWHVWSHWDGHWRSRVVRLHGVRDYLTEYHVLWGTRIRTGEGSWVILTEDRGATLRLPVSISDTDLPLCLKLAHIVGYDSRSGLAGIIDSALAGLVSASDTAKVFAPPTEL